MKTDYRQLSVVIFFITIFSQANSRVTAVLEVLESKFAIESEIAWRNKLNILSCDQTIFLDVDNDTSVAFKDSVIKNIHRYQSVTVFSGTNVPDKLAYNQENLNRYHNIVFTTKFLNPRILDNPLLVSMLKSHWSILFILVTAEDSLYTCDHGKFSEEAVNNIEEFLNSMWHKHRTMYIFLNLPYVCPDYYVVFNDTKPTDRGLYNRTTKLVNTDEEFLETVSINTGKKLTKNYPLRGNIFNRFPTAIKNCSGTDIYIKTTEETSGGFCGMDGLVMSDIVTHFEFNLTLPTLSPGYDNYGYQHADGALTGILKHIVNKDVDVSFNSRFMAKYTFGRQRYNYMHFVSRDALCAFMRQPEEKPLWQYPVNAYTWPQWLFILASLIEIGVIMWMFAKIRNSMHTRKISTLLGYILTSIHGGLFGFFYRRSKDLLVLRAACLYSSIIILAYYQSYINYVFTTRRQYATLKTLSDLVDSGTVTLTSPSIYGLINESYNELSAGLLSHTIVLENTDSFAYVMNHPNTATLERETDGIMWTLMQYTDRDDKPLLYVVNECLSVFYLCYISNSDFPFHMQLHIFLMRLIETGLPDMYYKWTSKALGLETFLPGIASEPRPAGKITLGEQVIPFSVLMVGYALSVVTFVLEIWWRRRQIYPFVT